jgi:glycolate oxidase FAD binding subunit
LAIDRVKARQHDLVVKAAAPISTSTTLVEILEKRLAGLEPIVWAHAGSGVAYAASNAPVDSEALLAARKDVLALGANASLVIERCPTILKRAIDVWGDPGPGLDLMRALKSQLDPKNTLNPGRYVGGI